MSTETLFNPSPAAQGQLLEALASDQSSINQLAQTFNTTAEALSLFITTDSFATRFAAIGSTNASLVRFSAGLNLHSAVKLLNTLALKLDEQLRTIPIDYTDPVAIEQFRRRAECARQVASALYRLSRFTHEPRPSRAASSDSDATSHQTRTPAPATAQTPNYPPAHPRAQWRDQPQDQPRNLPPEAAINQTLPPPSPAPASEPSPSPSATSRAASVTSVFLPSSPVSPASLPASTPAAPRSEPSPSASATSRASSVTSVFLPSSPASPASLPASTPAAPRSDPSPSATSQAASETSALLPSASAFPSSEPPDDESLEALANQLLALTNLLESKLPQPVS